MDELKKLRERIDWLDEQIASLLNERMRASDHVGRIKKATNQEVADPLREKYVLNHVETQVQHPTLKSNIANIYREIMQESKIAQRFFQQYSQPFHRIGVIGLGLIGGSICKGIKTKSPSVLIASLEHHSEDVFLAAESGWIDQIYSSIEEFISNCELIILASPISSVISLAKEIKRHGSFSQKKVVIDVASVKQDIVTVFEDLCCETMEFFGTHPMAGRENSGFSNSQATLFVNRPWVMVPHQKNTSSTQENIEEFIRYLGAEPVILEAKIHDQQAALVSHIPAILSRSYYGFVKATNPDSLNVSGPGFQDFTRLARDNVNMHREINTNNQAIIDKYLKEWLKYLIDNHKGI